MPKNSRSGRGKVSVFLCAVTVLTASVLLAVGIFATTSRTKQLFGLGSEEKPHRGRTLLSVLRNWTLPGNASRERADELWGRLLEKVKKAVGRSGASSTTATTKSRSRTSRPLATSTAAQSATRNDPFGDAETAPADYDRNDEYGAPGGANELERTRRTMPIRDETGAATPEDEIAAFFDGDLASNSSLRDTTNDSDQPAGSSSYPGVSAAAPRTELALVNDDDSAHLETVPTHRSVSGFKGHQDAPHAIGTRSEIVRGLENEEGTRGKLEAGGRGGTRRGMPSENNSGGAKADGSGVQETRQELAAAGTTYAREDLKARGRLDLDKVRVETGSALFRGGVDWIDGRLVTSSASDAVPDHSNISLVDTASPAQPPRRGIADEGQRFFARGADISTLNGKEGSLDVGPSTGAAGIQLNVSSASVVADVETNSRWSARLSDIGNSLFSGQDAGKAMSGIGRPVGASDRQSFEGPRKTTINEDDQPPPNKTAKYRENSRNKFGSFADTGRSVHYETSPLPGIVQSNAPAGSVHSSRAESRLPAPEDEQHPVASDLVAHSSVSAPTGIVADVQPVYSQTHVPEVTPGDVTGPTNFSSHQWLPLVPEILERAEGGETTELGDSGVSRDKGVRLRGDVSSEERAAKFSQGPLLDLGARNSASPLAWSPSEWTTGAVRPRGADSGGSGTEPFEEQEEGATLAANEGLSTSVRTMRPQRGNLDGSTPAATSSRETELFDLSRELDRIAHEFTEFLANKDRSSQGSSSGARVSSSLAPGEQLQTDEEITTVANSDSVPTASAVAEDPAMPTTGLEHIADSTSGDASSNVPRGHEEAVSSGNPDDETRPNAERTTSGRVTDTRPENEGGQIYCSVGPAYTGPLPPALCSYFLVYNAVEYNSNRKSFQVQSKGSWRALVSKGDRLRMGPRVLLVLSAGQVQNLVADFPVPAVFSTKAKTFIDARGLRGLALDLSLATDFDARSHAMLLRETKASLPGCHFVGLIDFFAASGLLRANLAELVGSVHKVFLRHDPQRVYTIGTSVPNPFASPNRRSYSVENAMRLAESLRLVSPDHNQVCLSVSLAVYKFSINDMDANYSSPGVGSLAFSVDTGFSYSELCKTYKGLHTHFDDASLSTYVHKGSAWLGFDDDTSMEIKIDKLSRGHRVGCLLADHIDLDDFKNVCKKGDFPRLRLLKRTFSSRQRR